MDDFGFGSQSNESNDETAKLLQEKKENGVHEPKDPFEQKPAIPIEPKKKENIKVEADPFAPIEKKAEKKVDLN